MIFSMNINETLIDPYQILIPILWDKIEIIWIYQKTKKQINLLWIIADNLKIGENQRGISYLINLIECIIYFMFLISQFGNHDGYNYRASIYINVFIYHSCCFIFIISDMYIKEIRKTNKNK